MGLDDLHDIFHQLARASDGYPPYNIEIIDDQTMQITIALAGFRMQDITITQEGNTLVIKGKMENTAHDRHFIHKGIAKRQFSKQFALTQGLEPAGATMDNGMLIITIKHNLQGREIKRIPITTVIDQNNKAKE